MRAMAVSGMSWGGYLVVCKVLFLYLSTSQGSPTLTILNATDPLVFEPNTTFEVFFSLEDAGSDNLTYTIFVNHKVTGSNVSPLKCFLKKTPENCSSNNEECKCIGGHQYSLKKVFQEKEVGEWTFTASVKNVLTTTTINIARQAHIIIENSTDPIVVQEGQKFDILFSVHEVPLPYRIFILHTATNSSVHHLPCVLLVSRDNYTTSDIETCRPLTQEASRHVYKLTKTFSLHESGELSFQVMNEQQNIIVKRKFAVTTPAAEETWEPSNDVTSPEKATIQTSPKATPSQTAPEKTAGPTSPRGSPLQTSSPKKGRFIATEASCPPTAANGECEVIIFIVAGTCGLMIVINIISCSFFCSIAKQSPRVLVAPTSCQPESKMARLNMDPIHKPPFSCNSWRGEKKKLAARPSTSSSEDDVSYACVYVDTGLYPIFDEYSDSQNEANN